MRDLPRRPEWLPTTLYRRVLLAGALTAVALFAVPGRADDKPAPQAGAAQKDYTAEVSRILPVDPVQSLKAFVVRPGFRVELAAAEPLLRSPVAMDFDEDGRLYVAEFPEYNQYADTKPHGNGCIRLLEDTDGDGVLRQEHALRRQRADGDGRRLLGRRRLRRVRSRPALPEGYRRRRQGRRAPRRFYRLRQGRGGRGDAELVPLGPRQPVPRLDQQRRRRRRPRPASPRRGRCRSAARASCSTRAARRSS